MIKFRPLKISVNTRLEQVYARMTSRSQPQPSPALRFYNISDSSPDSPHHTDLNKAAKSSIFGESSSCQTRGTGPDLVNLVFSVSVAARN